MVELLSSAGKALKRVQELSVLGEQTAAVFFLIGGRATILIHGYHLVMELGVKSRLLRGPELVKTLAPGGVC
jgi:hypothetical protein